MARLVGGRLSTAELAVRADDGEVGELEAGVVGGAVGDFEPAEIELAQAFQRLLQLDAGRVCAGAAQALDQHLGAGIASSIAGVTSPMPFFCAKSLASLTIGADS